MATEGMQFPGRGDGGTISLNVGVIWERSDEWSRKMQLTNHKMFSIGLFKAIAARHNGIRCALTGLGSPVIVGLSLFPAFLLLLFPVGTPIPNEELYFHVALRLVSEDGFSEYSAPGDFSNARFSSHFFMGSIIYIFGYDTGWILLRLLAAVLYAASFGFLVSCLKLSILDGFLALSVFCLMGQDLFGGEWLFRGFESKVLAYGLVLFGLAFTSKNRWLYATTAFIVSTYFHFLVGGFWFLAALIFHMLRSKDFKTTLYMLLLYILATLPLFIIISYEQSLRVPRITELPADYIYSIIRNPHHTAPFSNISIILSWLPKILFSFLLFIFMIYTAWIYERPFNTLPLFMSVLLFYLFFALAVSFFNAESGAIGKFYPNH